MKKTRFGAVIAAAVLTLAFAGTALANGQTNWTGNGLDNGSYNDGCQEDGPDTMLWIYNPGGNGTVTAAELFINGVSQGMMADKTGNFKLLTSYIAPGDLSSAWVIYTGTEGNNSTVTISHACEGEVTTTTEETTEETTETTVETTEETTETTVTTAETTEETTETTVETTEETTETTETTTTPDGSVEELTPPSTDTIAEPTSGSTVSTSLLLIVAGILAAAMVVVPAAARNRR